MLCSPPLKAANGRGSSAFTCPKNDYLGPIKKNRLFNIYLGLGIAVLATLIGLLIARFYRQTYEKLCNWKPML